MATPAAAGRPAQAPSPKKEADRAKEDALLQKASAVRAVWKTLATAFSPPPEEPPRNKCHWDFVLQEGAWLAHDVMQERMWKHAAASALSHAAVAFDRRKLRPVKTRVCMSVELPLSKYGHVKQDGKPVFPPSVAKAAPAEASQPSVQGGPGPHSPLFFTCPASNLVESLTEVLEEEDVMRLACHVEAQLVYHATVAAARRAQPMPTYAEEDLQQLGKRKRKAKPATTGAPTTEDEYEGGASPVVSARPPNRRTGGGGMAGPPRGSVADMGDELIMPGGRERRKRKMRDFGDDEYELPGKAAAAARAERGGIRGAAAAGGMGAAAAGVDRRVSHKAGAGMNARQIRGGGMQPMAGGRAGMVGPGMAGALPGAPAAGTYNGRPGLWNPQDDNLLAAIVTEFTQNWHLVADVLRSASSMSGVYRRWDTCKQRYGLLLRSYLGDGEQPLPEVPSNLQQTPLMNKAAAKEVVSAALPVQEAVLQTHQNVVAMLTTRMRQRKLAERQQTRASHQVHVSEHATHVKIQQAVLEHWGGRFGTPLDIGTVVDPLAQQAALLKQQQRQQQQQQQQQQAAAAAAALQQQQQQQQQAAAAAAALQQQQQQQQQAAAAAAAAAASQAHAAAAAASGAPYATGATPAPPTSLPLPPASSTDIATLTAQAQQAAAASSGMAAASRHGGMPSAAMPPLPAHAAAFAASMQGVVNAQSRSSTSGTPEPAAAAAAAAGMGGAPLQSSKSAGLAAEDTMGGMQAMPLAQLQAQAQAAQAAAAANPTPQMQMQAQMAAAMLAAAQSLRSPQLPPQPQQQPLPQQQPQQQQQQQQGAQAQPVVSLPGMPGVGLPPHAMPPSSAEMAAVAAAVSGAFPAAPMAGTSQQQQQQAALAQAQAQLAVLQAQFAPQGPQGMQGGMGQMQQQQQQQQQQGNFKQHHGSSQGGGSRGGGAGQQQQQQQQGIAGMMGAMGLPAGSAAPPSSGPLTPQQLQLQLQQVQQAAMWQGLPGMGNLQLPPQMAAAAAAAAQQHGQQLPPGSLPQFNLPQFGSK